MTGYENISIIEINTKAVNTEIHKFHIMIDTRQWENIYIVEINNNIKYLIPEEDKAIIEIRDAEKNDENPRIPKNPEEQKRGNPFRIPTDTYTKRTENAVLLGNNRAVT